MLTHRGRVTHAFVCKITIIGSVNGVSPGRRQAIIWTSDGILLIGPLRNKVQWNLNRNSNIFIEENTFENFVCEMLPISSRPQCVKARLHGEVPAIDAYKIPPDWYMYITVEMTRRELLREATTIKYAVIPIRRGVRTWWFDDGVWDLTHYGLMTSYGDLT